MAIKAAPCAYYRGPIADLFADRNGKNRDESSDETYDEVRFSALYIS
jgi:hypothetical protein